MLIAVMDKVHRSSIVIKNSWEEVDEDIFFRKPAMIFYSAEC